MNLRTYTISTPPTPCLQDACCVTLPLSLVTPLPFLPLPVPSFSATLPFDATVLAAASSSLSADSLSKLQSMCGPAQDLCISVFGKALFALSGNRPASLDPSWFKTTGGVVCNVKANDVLFCFTFSKSIYLLIQVKKSWIPMTTRDQWFCRPSSSCKCSHPSCHAFGCSRTSIVLERSEPLRVCCTRCPEGCSL